MSAQASADPAARKDASAAQPAKASRRQLLLSLVAAPIAGGAGFFVAWSGLLPPFWGSGHTGPEPASEVNNEFVPIPPITINLSGAPSRHVRFTAQLDVPRQHAAEVTRLMPRVLDVLNTYLRALDPSEFEEPAALIRLRGQMLRRLRILLGPERVNDLLITEFVFN